MAQRTTLAYLASVGQSCLTQVEGCVPLSPPHPCPAPGCRALTRERHCSQHRQLPDQRRPNAARRGYDAAWQQLRAQVLRDEPWCRFCQAEGRWVRATDVDHIMPKRRGGTDARANLRSLCHAHHSARTIAENPPRSRP